MKKEEKTGIMTKFGVHAKDTGSAPVQIALLTEKIKQLTEHLKTHRKDKHSRRGLIGMVGKRRKLLRFLQRKSQASYSEVIKTLGLRK
jgi:small subunit ribosomal protein S15